MVPMSRLSRWLGGAAKPDQASEPGGDWRLWRQACDGCASSARQLVQSLTPQAFSLALQMLGKREDAQDAVQDAFLRLWRSAPSDTHGARLSTYFNTIVINRCRTALTSRRELSTSPEDLAALQDQHDGQGAAAPIAMQPDHACHEQATRDRLQAGLAALPARQRMALAMWTYADASAADIAHAMDIDANAAHQLLHRAKQALRARLEGGAS